MFVLLRLVVGIMVLVVADEKYSDVAVLVVGNDNVKVVVNDFAIIDRN